MTSLTTKRVITRHYSLFSVSRGKGYQTMKLNQLIEYNMGIFFLINRTENVVEKRVPDHFLKNQS